ncbi:hypothetical protein [Streptomyces sp. NPDC057302]|uniref:hypothetical protein n=1 Tax=Streptomyces sp. NPDC057302 TaxID=3346094 RepID=UPI0036419BEA
MSTRRRRSLLRTAAVTALTGGALLTPAVAAVADSPAHSEATRTVAPAMPKGGVKAGTEGFQGGDPVFIAAGGAMAAAGAAGLGYAMLRRGRTDA